MFGEDYLSESPRVPSPWDSFLPSPPSEASSPEVRKHPRNGVPKLVPEVEEGNIEYKLKLTEISPARFARLVTQLKWRLLEGGGQAYYELGVADSGALIGLSRADLEQSLETLEMMAGEIGASVIVVKEIEVPPAMVALADKVSAYIDPETGKWTEKMSNKRHRTPYYADSDSAAASAGEAEATDLSEDDTSAVATPDFPPELGSRSALLLPYAHRLASTNPNRPNAQSSPSIDPIDSELALFSMEPEPSLDDTNDDADVEDTVPDCLADIPDLSLDIEITPVYKPRPVRRRVHLIAGSAAVARPPRRTYKNKDKKGSQLWHTNPSSLMNTASSEPLVTEPNTQEVKALNRRIARDKRREEKRKALMALAESDVADNVDPLAVSPPSTASQSAVALQAVEDAAPILVAGLQSLHVGVQSTDAVVLNDVSIIKEPSQNPFPTTSEPTAVTLMYSKEPRLIVEALVVRKMSLEEGFLDFEGFSLT